MDRYEKWCEIPIETSSLARMKADLYGDPNGFIQGKKVIPTQCVTVKGNVFVALFELAGAIYSGLEWDKKGRIVLEYDPQDGRFQVVTFQEAADLDTDPGREGVPRFLLRREDR